MGNLMTPGFYDAWKQPKYLQAKQSWKSTPPVATIFHDRFGFLRINLPRRRSTIFVPTIHEQLSHCSPKFHSLDPQNISSNLQVAKHDQFLFQ